MSKTADRTLKLLEAVARASKPCSLVELAARSDLDKSTASRLLGYLEEEGLLRRDESSKRYAVGPAFVSLAAMVMRKATLPLIAQPHLDRLRDETEETVSLHVRSGVERVCVAGAESPHVIQRVLTIGDPVPLWEGPTGKVILAHLPPGERETILAGAELSATARKRVDAQILETLEQGFLATVGDRTARVAAVSVPIFDVRGVIASITVAGPADRWNLDAMLAFAPTLLAAGERISAEIGGAGSEAGAAAVSPVGAAT